MIPADPYRTYSPIARRCGEGHPFRTEADCVLPEDWDNFLCRRCLLNAQTQGLVLEPYAAVALAANPEVETK